MSRDEDRRYDAEMAAALGDAARARMVGDGPDGEWDAEFAWHRDETDAEAAIAAAPGIMRRLREAGFRVVPHSCDLSDDHDGRCWYESGTEDD